MQLSKAGTRQTNERVEPRLSAHFNTERFIHSENEERERERETRET